MARLSLHVAVPYVAVTFLLSFFLISIWPEHHRPPTKSVLHQVVSHPDLRQVGCRNVTAETSRPRENGVLLVLTRGHAELSKIRHTIDSFEASFNRAFRYPYLFMAAPDEPFDQNFKDLVKYMLPHGAEIHFGEIGMDEWVLPSWLSETEVRHREAQMEYEGVKYVCVATCRIFQPLLTSISRYGGRRGYHHMCRSSSCRTSLLDLTRQQVDGSRGPLRTTPCSNHTTGTGGSSREVGHSCTASSFSY
jgi:hypothetical protein